MIESVFAWRKENSIRDLDYSKDPDKCLTLMYFRGKDVDGGSLKRENFLILPVSCLFSTVLFSTVVLYRMCCRFFQACLIFYFILSFWYQLVAMVTNVIHNRYRCIVGGTQSV